MSIFRRVIRAEKYWVIDRTFRRADGITERYRRVAQVQSKPAAEAEERRICDHWTAHGTIASLVKPEPKKTPASAEAKTKRPTWEDALDHFRAVALPVKKPSTRNGYETVLAGPHMRRWAGKPLIEITNAEIKKWDAALVTNGMESSTRRNQHIVMRSVLKSVGPLDGVPGVLLDALPRFPKLPPVGRKAVEAACPDDVAKLLSEVDDEKAQPVWSARRQKARLAFALGALAGMRASEIRGLRRRDVDLKRGVITIRLGRITGEESTPKSGHERQIPIARALLPMLKDACEGLDGGGYVATTYEGSPWSDNGIWAALIRACKRLEISRNRVHGLRHYFATTLFGGGADARTVQDLLGHGSLEVTQRYAHTNATRAKAAMAIFSDVRVRSIDAAE